MAYRSKKRKQSYRPKSRPSLQEPWDPTAGWGQEFDISTGTPKLQRQQLAVKGLPEEYVEEGPGAENLDDPTEELTEEDARVAGFDNLEEYKEWVKAVKQQSETAKTTPRPWEAVQSDPLNCPNHRFVRDKYGIYCDRCGNSIEDIQEAEELAGVESGEDAEYQRWLKEHSGGPSAAKVVPQRKDPVLDQKFCPDCGHVQSVGKYCNNCGEELQEFGEEGESSTAEYLECPMCGNIQEASAGDWCENCFSWMEPQKQGRTIEVPSSKGGGKATVSGWGQWNDYGAGQYQYYGKGYGKPIKRGGTCVAGEYPINLPGKLYHGKLYTFEEEKRDTLKDLKEKNVSVIWDLLEYAGTALDWEKKNFETVIHTPIKDYGLPLSPEKFLADAKQILAYLKEGKNVYVHCHAGHGRTGTGVSTVAILAGMDPLDALNTSITECHGPETEGQIEFVFDLFDPEVGVKKLEEEAKERKAQTFAWKGQGPGAYTYVPAYQSGSAGSSARKKQCPKGGNHSIVWTRLGGYKCPKCGQNINAFGETMAKAVNPKNPGSSKCPKGGEHEKGTWDNDFGYRCQKCGAKLNYYNNTEVSDPYTEWTPPQQRETKTQTTQTTQTTQKAKGAPETRLLSFEGRCPNDKPHRLTFTKDKGYHCSECGTKYDMKEGKWEEGPPKEQPKPTTPPKGLKRLKPPPKPKPKPPKRGSLERQEKQAAVISLMRKVRGGRGFSIF
jgi:hypothetical protein